MAYLRTLASVAVISTLAACTFNTTVPKSDATLNAEAQANFADLVAGRDDAILARLSAENPVDAAKAQLPMLRQMVGDAPVPEAVVTGSQSVTGNQGSFYRVSQDYAYSDRVAHVQTNFIKQGGGWKIMAFNVNVNMKGAPAAAPQT